MRGRESWAIVALLTACQGETQDVGPATRVTPPPKPNGAAPQTGQCPSAKVSKFGIYNGSAPESRILASTVLLLSPTGSCSGSLVGTGTVLTAGHCVQALGTSQVSVRFGSDGLKPTLKCTVTKLATHPGYNLPPARDDLAFAYFSCGSSSLPSGTVIVSPASAPVGAQDALVIAGFGISQYGDQEWRLLQTAAGISMTDAGEKVFYTRSSDGQVCSGDSGGPVYVEREGSLWVAGVVSGGEPGQGGSCGGALAKITSLEHADYREWISSIVAQQPSGATINGGDVSPAKGPSTSPTSDPLLPGQSSECL